MLDRIGFAYLIQQQTHSIYSGPTRVDIIYSFGHNKSHTRPQTFCLTITFARGKCERMVSVNHNFLQNVLYHLQNEKKAAKILTSVYLVM